MAQNVIAAIGRVHHYLGNLDLGNVQRVSDLAAVHDTVRQYVVFFPNLVNMKKLFHRPRGYKSLCHHDFAIS